MPSGGTVHWVGWWAGSQEGDVVVGGHRCRARCVVVQHDWFWLDVQCVVVVMLGWNRDVPSHGVLSCICLAPRLAVVAAREHLWRSCWGRWGGVRWCGVPILGGVFIQCVGSLSRHGTVPSVSLRQVAAVHISPLTLGVVEGQRGVWEEGERQWVGVGSQQRLCMLRRRQPMHDTANDRWQVK